MWYVISPGGSAWVAVEIDEAGRLANTVEEANAETHRAANDQFGWVCEAIANGQVSENVNPEVAATVVQAWDGDADATACCVERVVAD